MTTIHRATRVRRAGGLVIASAAVAAGLLAGMMAAPADAHETREVGDLVFTVGWGDEPAFTGFKNRVQAILSTADEEPIREGVELTAEVSVEGEEPKEVEIEPRFGESFGEPGDYGGDLIPTRPGNYTFRLVGTVNGQEVDEEFTSGEETFDAPREPSDVAYPVADPSNAALAERVDRELARAADEGGSDSDTGTILGIVGIVVAVIAVSGAGIALRRSRAGA